MLKSAGALHILIAQGFHLLIDLFKWQIHRGGKNIRNSKSVCFCTEHTKLCKYATVQGLQTHGEQKAPEFTKRSADFKPKCCSTSHKSHYRPNYYNDLYMLSMQQCFNLNSTFEKLNNREGGWKLRKQCYAQYFQYIIKIWFQRISIYYPYSVQQLRWENWQRWR